MVTIEYKGIRPDDPGQAPADAGRSVWLNRRIMDGNALEIEKD